MFWNNSITTIGNGNSVTMNSANGKTIINGKEYIGNNISVINNKVIIDGKDVTEDFGNTIQNITINGDVSNVKCESGGLTINGNVTGDVDAGHSVTCGDVSGNVSSGHSIKCKSIGGNAKAGHSISRL